VRRVAVEFGFRIFLSKIGSWYLSPSRRKVYLIEKLRCRGLSKSFSIIAANNRFEMIRRVKPGTDDVLQQDCCQVIVIRVGPDWPVS
jgi:hypothetical protein